MGSRVAFPFNTLPGEAIHQDPWVIGNPGQPLAKVADVLENWDYARDLEICTQLTIDWGLAVEALQLPLERLRLKGVLAIGTGTGNLPRRQNALQEVFIDASTNVCRFSGIVKGRNLSGRLRLSVQVLLDAPISSGSPLSPKERGSRLWQSHQEILIEDGGSSRFPIEAISFSQCFCGLPQQHSPWYLHWPAGSLRADFSASVRLYVNSDNKEFAKRVVDGDGPTLQAILGDVMSQMITYVLDQDDYAEILAECEEGAVARQIRRWLDVAFPEYELSGIREMKSRLPGRFRAAILAAADMDAPA